MSSKWQEALREELESESPVQRAQLAAAWMTEISREVLPYLREQRREAILAAWEEDPENHTRQWLAEQIGGRPATFDRLLTEARHARRQRATVAPGIVND